MRKNKPISVYKSLNTKYCIHYTFDHLINKSAVIIELGSWLGASTIELLKKSKENSSVYCFDKFQNIMLSDYTFNKKHPLDKFWFTTPRYEVFCRNIKNYMKNKKVYTIKDDVNTSIELLKKHKIYPDIVFIDAIKHTNALCAYIKKLYVYNSNVIVIGDDYVFDSVKNAVKILVKELNVHCLYTNDCYIMYSKINHSTSYTINHSTSYTINHSTSYTINPTDLNIDLEQYINKKIKSNYVIYLVDLLFKKEYTTITSLIKQKIPNINAPIYEFCNNTFYTLIIIEIYSKKINEAQLVLNELNQLMAANNIKARPIKNALGLTYKDYMRTYISF